MKPDGGAYLIGEPLNTIRRTSSSGSEYTEYFFMNIYVTEFSKSGEIINEIIIPKQQWFNRIYSSSFITLYNPENDQLHFVFNDYKFNEGKITLTSDYQEKGKHKDKLLIAVSVSNGKIISRK